MAEVGGGGVNQARAPPQNAAPMSDHSGSMRRMTHNRIVIQAEFFKVTDDALTAAFTFAERHGETLEVHHVAANHNNFEIRISTSGDVREVANDLYRLQVALHVEVD